MYKPLIWAGTGVLAILAVFLLAATSQTFNTATTTNTVTFTGQGKVFAKPDVAVASFSIVTEAATTKEAQDQNSKKSKAVIEFIKKQGIEDKDFKTTFYTIYPQYDYGPPPARPQVRAYQANETLEVKIRDLAKMSKILDGVVAAGASQVNNLSLQIDDPEGLKTEARLKALQDAKDKARELARQADIRLGKIVNYSEGIGGFPPPIIYGRGAGGGGGPDIAPGQNEIVITVTLTYQIK